MRSSMSASGARTTLSSSPACHSSCARSSPYVSLVLFHDTIRTRRAERLNVALALALASPSSATPSTIKPAGQEYVHPMTERYFLAHYRTWHIGPNKYTHGY